jgi:predicted nucleic acid-binding protein
VIVVDASAMLEVLLDLPSGPAIRKRMLEPGETLHAPHLIDLEVCQVLRRYNLAGTVSPSRGRQALEDYADFSIGRYAHGALLPRIWELRHNLTAYDAAYVALAEALGCPLITCDRAVRSVKGIHAAVFVF